MPTNVPMDALPSLPAVSVRQATSRSDTSHSELRAVHSSLVDELAEHANLGADAAAVAEQVRTALEELHGSVSVEALPEMAARLALHRLAAAASAAATPPVSRRPPRLRSAS